jgi:uncharacterized protein YbcI
VSGTTHEDSPRDHVTAKISDEIVRLLAAETGHGATRAWTTLGEDLIVCVLQGVLSKGEQNLVRNGTREVVLRTRRAYQEMMERDAVAAVEQISGRTVRAFTSANHLDEDIAVEIFVLEPLEDGSRETRRARQRAPWPARASPRHRGD